VDLVIGTAGDREFSVDAQELVTGRTCIIAQSGAGKSWAIAVLCERLCSAGIGFVIVDTEGEYSSIMEKYPVLWVGSEEECDEDIEKVSLKDLMLRAVVNGTAVVFDVSETDMREKVAALAEVLYDIASAHRIPYLLILEEADKFIPQAKESLRKIEEISRRGRKRGLGLLVATQRPSFVTKNSPGRRVASSSTSDREPKKRSTARRSFSMESFPMAWLLHWERTFLVTKEGRWVATRRPRPRFLPLREISSIFLRDSFACGMNLSASSRIRR